jgi:hypothetical protein
MLRARPIGKYLDKVKGLEARRPSALSSGLQCCAADAVMTGILIPTDVLMGALDMEELGLSSFRRKSV